MKLRRRIAIGLISPLAILVSLICLYTWWTPSQVIVSRGGGGGPAVTTVSGLSSQTSKYLAIVTNGSSSSDCTVGGGSTVVLCLYSGTAWSNPYTDTVAATNTISVSSACNSQPNCYTVYDDVQIVSDATTANLSPTVTTTTNDPPFACPGGTFPCSSGGDVGKIAFATNGPGTGGPAQAASVLTCPQTTISTVNSAHSVTLAANCTNTSSWFLWGHDDSTNLATAWTAAVNTCSNLLLPGGNSEGTGRAAFFVQQAEFDASSVTCVASDANRTGYGLRGNPNKPLIVPTPNFNAATCTYGAGLACFFTVPNGLFIEDVELFGAAQNPSGMTTNVITEVNPSCHGTQGCNSQIDNLVLMGWGAGSIGYGLQIDGGEVPNTGIDVDGAGEIGCNIVSIHFEMHHGACQDNYSSNLVISGAAGMTSMGSYYCCTERNDGNGALIQALGNFWSFGDTIGYGIATNQTNGVQVGASTYLIGDDINLSTTSHGVGIYISSSNGAAYLQDSKVNATGTSAYGVYNVGSLFDLGGNTVTGTTVYSCASCVGNFGEANSANNTALATGNLTLSANWGTSPTKTAFIGGDFPAGFTITNGSASTGTSPTITWVFPKPLFVAPFSCSVTQTGGTNAIGTFTVSSLTATGFTATYSLTPTASDTEIVYANCVTP